MDPPGRCRQCLGENRERREVSCAATRSVPEYCTLGHYAKLIRGAVLLVLKLRRVLLRQLLVRRDTFVLAASHPYHYTVTCRTFASYISGMYHLQSTLPK